MAVEMAVEMGVEMSNDHEATHRLVTHLAGELNNSLLAVRSAQIALQKARTSDARTGALDRAEKRLEQSRASLLETCKTYQALRQRLDYQPPGPTLG